MSIADKLKVAKNVVTSKVALQLLKVEKASPTLLFVGGIASVGVSTVLACKSTLKLESVTSEFNSDLEKARASVGKPTSDGGVYTSKDRGRDAYVLTCRKVVAVGKLYAPAIVFGALGVAALAGSHNIMRKRNAGLVAAYAALDEGFRAYRGRVVAKYGEETDRELRYGLEEREVVVEGPDGPEVKTEKKATVGPEIYSKIFSRETSASWKPVEIYNESFLRAVQKYSNDQLKANGYVMLNDVYHDLGLARTKAGAVVGWALGNGDGFISFEIDRGLMNAGENGEILLDFNVDGVVLDLIEKDNKNRG